MFTKSIFDIEQWYFNFIQATGNVFDMKKLNCTFNENYFNVTNSECILKAEGGRNKLAGGHAQLIKAVDDVMVRKFKKKSI